jgi:hypothetical protein
MQLLAAMKTKYEQLRYIHDLAVKTNDASALREIPSLLNNWGFKCRDNDGQLLWTNLSLPTSIGETITIGLRYKKNDQTLTEDVFEVNSGTPEVVDTYYKGKYQKARPEYAGTHKLQDVQEKSFISVNSCSLYMGRNNGS